MIQRERERERESESESERETRARERWIEDRKWIEMISPSRKIRERERETDIKSLEGRRDEDHARERDMDMRSPERLSERNRLMRSALEK